MLARYVREQRTLTLTDAIRKMSLMPAQRLERATAAAARKGRLQVGADADIAVFDLATVADRATYAAPALPAAGFKHVLVNGTPVVRDGSCWKSRRAARSSGSVTRAMHEPTASARRHEDTKTQRQFGFVSSCLRDLCARAVGACSDYAGLTRNRCASPERRRT